MSETWIQFISVISTVLGSAYFVNRNIKQDHKEFRDELKIQSARSDTLYQMFIDLLKESRK